MISARKLTQAALLASTALLTPACSSIPTVGQTEPEWVKGDNPARYYDGGALAGALAARNLEEFDDLDFNVFSNQEWTRLHETHAEDIIVTWPDGHDTHGIDVHIEDLKKLFVHAPDTEIKLHPIKIAAGNWTAVHGVMSGTFTEPLPLPDGSSIPPTGNRYSVNMATMALWKDGQIIHEWLFWDNQTYQQQLGLIK